MLTLKSDLIYSTQTTKNKKSIRIEIDHTFFGITQEYQTKLYDQIFDFVYYSEGAFSVDEVRNWPITLRMHYVNRLGKILEEKSKQIQKAKSRKR